MNTQQNRYGTIVSVERLAACLDDPSWRVVDCRFSLLEPDKGRQDYADGHVPGAAYAHLDDDLAAAVGPQTGRHPLPAADIFIERLRDWGVTDDSQVVVYDDASGGLAARLWWMLRHWLGHPHVAVLDGGFAAWRDGGHPVSGAAPTPAAGDFSGRPDADQVLATEALTRRLEQPDFVLVDAREAQRFRGEQEPIDPVAGHVPGALNLPFTDSLDDRLRWRSPDELARLWSTVVGPADGDWAVMCGSGVTACHLALSAARAGLSVPRLYVGSWSEWIRDPERPVATGPAAADSG